MGNFRRPATGIGFEPSFINALSMVTRNQVHFLQQKIMELQQALFFNTSEAVLKLPVSVVNALQVDDVGQVWFLASRPQQHISEFGNNIPAKLEFYKKGKNYYVHVWGQARLVSDPEEINNVAGISPEIRQQALSPKWMLIALKITHSHYYIYPEHRPVKKREPVKLHWRPSGFVKTLQYIVKDIIPVFQSH